MSWVKIFSSTNTAKSIQNIPTKFGDQIVFEGHLPGSHINGAFTPPGITLMGYEGSYETFGSLHVLVGNHGYKQKFSLWRPYHDGGEPGGYVKYPFDNGFPIFDKEEEPKPEPKLRLSGNAIYGEPLPIP